MPINIGTDKNGHYIRYGHRTKYYYKSNSIRSFTIARNKAIKQMKAIYNKKM